VALRAAALFGRVGLGIEGPGRCDTRPVETRQEPQPHAEAIYNQVATERSLERIGALSDGLFAIAMTLIVLEIRVPALDHRTDADLAVALASLAPRFLTYILSFLTLGIFWNAQHSQLNYVARADRHFAWLQLAYLAVVALLPFSTSLLAEFIDLRLAFAVYWLNLLALGVMLYAIWTYAEHAGLTQPGVTAAISTALKRRIVNYQALYFVGFLLGLWLGPLPAIVFVVLVQLNSAIAPRLPILWRL
jgi:TMEM175 potassium channel family protein